MSEEDEENETDSLAYRQTLINQYNLKRKRETQNEMNSKMQTLLYLKFFIALIFVKGYFITDFKISSTI